MADKTEHIQKMNKMAQDVLELSRNTLLVNLRFLDEALSQFRYQSDIEGTLYTDGLFLYYNPEYVLSNYIMEKQVPVRDYLHVVLHCIYQHMYGAQNLQRNLWDLACDIAVEHSITSLGLDSTAAKREKKQLPEFQKIEKGVRSMTAEQIYRYLLDSDISEDEQRRLHFLFLADDHRIWYQIQEKVPLDRIDANAGEEEEGGRDEEKAGNDIKGLRARQAQTWMEIASRLHLNMETFAKKRGDSAGDIIQNLEELHREKYDYTAFLKKFAVIGEVMKINDDDFDYVFYTYGLKLYKNMPLIEPLENKEIKRIREFVIAIDTSGSVRGEVVQAFVQKTYNVLKSTESFFSKINLHIFLCDSIIQDHVKITDQNEFDEYIKTMKIKGLGGTDFRPVFEEVDRLIENRELSELKGLIYFTDGHGIFPARKPKYQTAFVFVDDGNNNPDLPPWAIKLMLRKDEVLKDVFKL